MHFSVIVAFTEDMIWSGKMKCGFLAGLAVALSTGVVCALLLFSTPVFVRFCSFRPESLFEPIVEFVFLLVVSFPESWAVTAKGSNKATAVNSAKRDKRDNFTMTGISRMV